METIGDLLSRDLNQRIEEVIQVHQADQQSVYSEVSEYVATNSIQDQYALLLKAIAEAPAEPGIVAALTTAMTPTLATAAMATATVTSRSFRTASSRMPATLDGRVTPSTRTMIAAHPKPNLRESWELA